MKLTESAYLGVLPIAGTLVAYLFEYGFALYHGIPASLIQLSVSQFVTAAVMGLLALWAIHMYLSLGAAFLTRRKLLVFKFAGLGMLYAFPPFLFLLGVGNELRIWIIFIISFLFPSVMGFFGALFSKAQSPSFVQRWWEQSSFELNGVPEVPKDRLHSLIDVPQQWFSVLMFSMFLAVAVGYRYASEVLPSMVTKSDPSKAFIVIYGERWFFRSMSEVNQRRSISKGELTVISGDSAKEVVLIQAIGAGKASDK